MTRWRSVSLLVAGVVALAVAVLAALLHGPTAIPWTRVAGVLVHPDRSVVSTIVWQIRLPRVMAALLCGGSLAVAGAVMQALLRNPLADPYVIGASAGAGLGATIGQIFFAALDAVAPGAFLGALAAVFMAFGLAHGQGRLRMLTLILAGYAVGVILAAMTTFLMLLHRESLASIFAFEVGGLNGIDWSRLVLPGIFMPLAFALVLPLLPEMDALLLGEEQAFYVGAHMRRVEILLVLAASLLTASAVYLGGLIGFVGLVVPHAVRRLVGAGHRRLIPLVFLAGATFLVLADTIAERVPWVGNIPVGLVTALLGGPYFLYLLSRQGHWSSEVV